MLGCWRSEASRASLMNISPKLGSDERRRSIRLMATGRSKPSAPRKTPRKTSAMPPPPIFSPTAYLSPISATRREYSCFCPVGRPSLRTASARRAARGARLPTRCQICCASPKRAAAAAVGICPAPGSWPDLLRLSKARCCSGGRRPRGSRPGAKSAAPLQSALLQRRSASARLPARGQICCASSKCAAAAAVGVRAAPDPGPNLLRLSKVRCCSGGQRLPGARPGAESLRSATLGRAAASHGVAVARRGRDARTVLGDNLAPARIALEDSAHRGALIPVKFVVSELRLLDALGLAAARFPAPLAGGRCAASERR